MTTRRKYTKEFKLDAIALVNEQGYSWTEAARHLDISPVYLVSGSDKQKRMMAMLSEIMGN